MKSWILVGMMGCGKSSVGRSLANKTGRRFLDTDQLVQQKIGRPIRHFFEIYGEVAFREFETATLAALEPDEVVLATGGGIVLRPENWTQLRRLGPTFYLRAMPETLHRRLEITRNRRPLLQADDWKSTLDRILEGRNEVYEQADFAIDVDHLEIDEVADAIIAKAETA